MLPEDTPAAFVVFESISKYSFFCRGTIEVSNDNPFTVAFTK